jgi:hypothetical protein
VTPLCGRPLIDHACAPRDETNRRVGALHRDVVMQILCERTPSAYLQAVRFYAETVDSSLVVNTLLYVAYDQSRDTMSTKAEVHKIAGELADLFGEESFFNGVVDAASAAGGGIPNADIVMSEIEKGQVDYLNKNGKVGKVVMAQLRKAAKVYPDMETRAIVMRLVHAEELCIAKVQDTVAEKNGLEPPNRGMHMGGGDAHGHGHSHGDHGHSHGPNGQCPNHSPQQAQQMQMQMQMAMSALSENEKKEMARLQMKMMQGQPPTPQDLASLGTIRQKMMTYMATMSAVMPGLGGGPAPAPPTGESPPGDGHKPTTDSKLD